MQYLIVVRSLRGLLLGILLATPAAAREKTYPGPFVENDDLLMVLNPHTPEQMTAFYEARGFPKAALALIGDACFVTVSIKNKSKRIIWLETANWQLSSNKKKIQPRSKKDWDAHWDKIDLPLASRATFGWTQLPVQRDLQPDEPVGGNITLDSDIKTFDLEAHFLTGANKRGGMLDVRFQNINCPKETPRE